MCEVESSLLYSPQKRLLFTLSIETHKGGLKNIVAYEVAWSGGSLEGNDSGTAGVCVQAHAMCTAQLQWHCLRDRRLHGTGCPERHFLTRRQGHRIGTQGSAMYGL